MILSARGGQGEMVNPDQPYALTKIEDTMEVLDDMYDNDQGMVPLESNRPFLLGSCQCLGNCGLYNEEIPQGFVGVLTEYGRFVRVLPSGLQSYNPFTQNLTKVPVTIQIRHMHSQTVLTYDGLQLLISGYVKYQIVHPELYLFNHSNPEDMMERAVTGSMRAVIGQRTLADNLNNQQEIKTNLLRTACTQVEMYGIMIMDTEIERMTMDAELLRAMACVPEAERNASATIVKSKATLEASKAIEKTGRELAKTPLSLQLKYIEVIKNVTGGNSTLLLRDTIVNEYKKRVRSQL